MKTESTRLETLAVHAGQAPEPTTGAITTPIFLTSTYVQAGPGEHKGFEYSRTHNPTRYALETAQLQHDYFECWQGLRKHFDPRKP